MQIYIARSGQQTGPFSPEQIHSMISSGSIVLTDSAWHEGLSSWVPLYQILNIPAPIPQPPPFMPSMAAQPSAMFLYIPITRLVVMGIVSFGIYEAYWNYRNWRYFKERDGLDISPFWRGIFGIFFIRSLFENIKNDHTNQIRPATFSANGLAAGWIIVVLLDRLLSRSSDPALNLLGMMIAIPSFCFFLPVQKHINALNEASEVRPAYHGWSSGHIVCLVLGIIFWLLVLVGLTQ